MAATTSAADLAFPGALGWAANTPGGRGGQILRVTNLNASGPGSFAAAVNTKGPRIVVFEIGGVIDLGKQEIKISEPFLTIAGQTAPRPGITFIKGGFNISTHDVVIQHIRVRPGEAGAAKKSGWEPDGITAWSARDIIVDHCSITWAVDENLSASGPRFDGGDFEEDWRKATSFRVTFSNNLLAEGLSNSSHSKGEHSKGSLIHDNTHEIFIVGNLYASNMERHPLLKGGGKVVVANNLIVNPGRRALHYSLNPEEWGEHSYVTGQLVAVGNVVRAGPSSVPDLAFLLLSGAGDLELHQTDNVMTRGTAQLPLLKRERFTGRLIELPRPPMWPPGFVAQPSAQTADVVLKNAGARPWDRDAIDVRIVSDARAGTGRIIDSETDVGGYPKGAMTRRPFDPKAWNLADMTPRNPQLLEQ
jgi:hypothetical protein